MSEEKERRRPACSLNPGQIKVPPMLPGHMTPALVTISDQPVCWSGLLSFNQLELVVKSRRKLGHQREEVNACASADDQNLSQSRAEGSSSGPTQPLAGSSDF